jgi:divalent metal cation (Fe/Co/Zn/Cd) transporter
MTNGSRSQHLARAVRLEYLTVGWNIVEGIIAVSAGLAAGSVALLAFGIDSFVEMTSGAILAWRLLAETKARDAEAVEALDRKARKLVGISLFLLGAWVLFDATRALWTRDKPEASVVGIVVTSVSLLVMSWLAREKRRSAAALKSRALESDSFQTTACWWLSLITLAGIGVNTAFGWWWADPVAALGATVFIIREAREAWRGEDSCSDCGH